MKKILYLAICGMLLFIGAACKKDVYELQGTTNTTLINALIGGGDIKINPGATSAFVYSKATAVPYGSSGQFGGFVGTNTITVVSAADTTKTLFSRIIDVKPISTLYIAGQSPAIDTIYRVETNIPYIDGAAFNLDNSCYLRFVNLSPNSPPLNINIRNVTTNEVIALSYKGISPFIKYAARTTAPVTPTYFFEIRNATTNALINTLAIAPQSLRFKTISVIMRGLVGTTGVNGFGTFQVSYFN